MKFGMFIFGISTENVLSFFYVFDKVSDCVTRILNIENSVAKMAVLRLLNLSNSLAQNALEAII